MTMPADSPPRRITIHKVPYDFYHSRTAVTCYSEPGEFLVPAKVADDAVAKGYATEGWARDSKTRTSKGGPKRKHTTRRAKSAKPKADAATNTRSKPGMGGAAVAAAHRAVTGRPVAPAAE